MSTFHGLEMAKQALFTQQMGLYTTGHNLSNVNTEGFSRQRVNFEAMSPFPSASRNRPSIPGQLGTGVMAGTVQRIRDAYLDSQYRTQNSKTAYWETRATALNRMESFMNEMDETNGLSKTMNDFWKSLETLSTNPENAGARGVAVENGVMVAESFNHIATSLEQIQKDLRTQIGTYNDDTKEYDGKIGDANALLKQINDLNKQIGEVEPLGYLPNDLYDRRDRLIDELSSIIKIDVKYEKSGDSSLKIADGIAVIRLANQDGTPTNHVLLSATDRNLTDDKIGQFGVTDVSGKNAIGSITFTKAGDSNGNFEIENDDFLKYDGSLKALIETYGYVKQEGTETKITGDFSDTLERLNKLAENFAKAFNEVHQTGYVVLKEGETATDDKKGKDFFMTNDGSESITAKNLAVSSEIREHPDLLAISSDGKFGNGDVAKKLAEVMTEPLKDNALGSQTSVKGYFQQIISKMAVDTRAANQRVANDNVLQQKIQNDRLSVSAVSIDEEMTNLLKFQHAYNASARSMTAMDEILDKIINSMGLVGR